MDMKKRTLAGAAGLALSVLVSGTEPALAGGGGGIAPQEHWPSTPPQSVSVEPIETGALLAQEAGKPPVDLDVRSPQPGGDASATDEAWRWRESGG